MSTPPQGWGLQQQQQPGQPGYGQQPPPGYQYGQQGPPGPPRPPAPPKKKRTGHNRGFFTNSDFPVADAEAVVRKTAEELISR